MGGTFRSLRYYNYRLYASGVFFYQYWHMAATYGPGLAGSHRVDQSQCHRSWPGHGLPVWPHAVPLPPDRYCRRLF